ncbi:uncharacterized protein LOC126265595 [Aethina tumida]|uniref:uncharacterized protein LOC126265595 n=1 Tax=Aethina tumida TaxID=116153 RepID=UPI0021472503|nr:uncharacterized protein LOC126265595 [Aethina tumida]
MAEDKVGVPHFDKLDGKNFTLWKLQMQTFLDVYGLRKIVNGTERRPDGTNESGDQNWIKKDAKAKLAILTAINVDQLDYVSACETAEDMWISLLSILTDLPDDYEVIVDTWDSVADNQKTVAALKMKLLQREVRIEAKANKEPLQALVVSKKSVGKEEKKIANGERQKRNVKCYKCQNFGHFALSTVQRRSTMIVILTLVE